MSEQGVCKVEYGTLSTKIEKHNDIQSALKTAYELTKSVQKEKEKYIDNPTRYNQLDEMMKRFIKEYIDLEKSIKDAIKNDNKISEEEKATIMFELSDLVNLSEKLEIEEYKNGWSKLGDKIRKTNTEKAKKEASNLRDKKINEYTKDESISALKYLNDNYKTGPWAKENSFGNIFAIHYHTINQLDDFGEVNMYQELLVEKILGKGKEFNEQYILGFSNNKGNYIEKISDFEKGLEKGTIENINSKALSNYFLYLDSTGKLNTEYIMKFIGGDLLKNIKNEWSKGGSSKVKDILINRGILDKVESIINIAAEDIKKWVIH